MSKILTLGESLLRLSTSKKDTLSTSNQLNIHYGGAESNLAVNLSNLGHSVKYATKLPINNSLSDRVVKELQSYRVDCSHILYGPGRLGSYFLEMGTGLRAGSVLYDRKYSTISTMEENEWDLDQLFKDVSLFHLTGITLALSSEWHVIGKELIEEAIKRKIKISFDMNYRQKMWSHDSAKKVYAEVLPYIDYLSAGKLDAIHFMDIKEQEDADWEYYVKKIANKYPNLEYIYGTNRELITANSFDMTGYIWDVKNMKGLLSEKYVIHQVVDRVGSGDSYAAAILDGIIHKKELKNIINFAIAASALKHTVLGDINPFNRMEIEDFMSSTTDVVR